MIYKLLNFVKTAFMRRSVAHSFNRFSKILSLAVKNIQVNLIFIARLFIRIFGVNAEYTYSVVQGTALPILMHKLTFSQF